MRKKCVPIRDEKDALCRAREPASIEALSLMLVR
jgi:hypothetical protein